MSLHHMNAWYHVSQKRVLDPLKLELQMVMSYHVGTVNPTYAFWKNDHCS